MCELTHSVQNFTGVPCAFNMKKILSLDKFYTHAVTDVTDKYQVWGWTTVTSKAASRPPAQRGTKISAGRRSAPGSKNLPSLLGPSPALIAVSKKASLKALCLLILSPPVPQQRAWSPMTSLRRRQAGHWAGTLGIVDWQPQLVLDCQNKL